MKKIRNIILITILTITLLLTLISLITGVIHLCKYNNKFRTNFNLMYGYKSWGRDYAREIIKEEYENEHVLFEYKVANTNWEYENDIIKPYLVTIYFYDKDIKPIIYVAWTNGETYNIEWEVIYNES